MRRWMWVGLAAAGASLVARGLVSLEPAAGGSAPVEEEWGETAEAPTQAEAPPAIEPAVVVAYLESLSGAPRSPFLREDELASEGGDAAEPGLPALSGTLLGAGRRVAWLDGAPLTEGEAVRGQRVERIERGAVTLGANGNPVRLELPPPGAEPPAPPAEASEGDRDR